MQAIENHFKADEQLMKEINLLNDPEFKEKLDRETLLFIQAIRNVIQFKDSTSRKKSTGNTKKNG